MGSYCSVSCALFLLCFILQLNYVEITAKAISNYYGGYRADVYFIQPQIKRTEPEVEDGDGDEQLLFEPSYEVTVRHKGYPAISSDFDHERKDQEEINSERILFTSQSPHQPQKHYRRRLPTRITNTPENFQTPSSDLWMKPRRYPEDGKQREHIPLSNFVSEDEQVMISPRFGYSTHSLPFRSEFPKSSENTEDFLKDFKEWLATTEKSQATTITTITTTTSKPDAESDSSNDNSTPDPDSILPQSLTQVFNEKKCAEGHKRVQGSRECKPRIRV